MNDFLKKIISIEKVSKFMSWQQTRRRKSQTYKTHLPALGKSCEASPGVIVRVLNQAGSFDF